MNQFEQLSQIHRNAILSTCADFIKSWQSDSIQSIETIVAQALPDTVVDVGDTAAENGSTIAAVTQARAIRPAPDEQSPTLAKAEFQQPTNESVLTAQAVLRYELLKIDVQKRLDSDGSVAAVSYTQHLPSHDELITSVFDELNSGTMTTLGLDAADTQVAASDSPRSDVDPHGPVRDREASATAPTVHVGTVAEPALDERSLPTEVDTGEKTAQEDHVDSLGSDLPRTISETESDSNNLETMSESQISTIVQTDTQMRIQGSVIPHSLGDYELLQKLGEGGMGVVYLANQRSAGRKVALKIIRPDRLGLLSQSRNQKAIERFRTEALAAARIHHDNLVTVYEVGLEQGYHFFSMQFVQGGSLSDILKSGPVETKQAAAWLEPACRAVQAIHDNGILHRDLKPQNILLDESTQRTLVADFGLAKLSESDVELTHSGEAMGTPPYMSPEQFRDAASVTVGTDVYALGATLYHLLSGRPPFQAATTAQTMRQVMDKEPVAIRELNSEVDRDLETICMKCLEKEPSKRYSSAEEIADELKRYLEGRPIVARPVSRMERGIRWCRRNPLVASLVAVAAVSLITAVAALAVTNVKTENARQRAEASFQDALEAVNDFFTKVSEERLLNEPGMQGLRKDLLQRAETYYKRLLARRAGDPAVSQELAGTHYRLGIIIEQLYPNELSKALASFNLARESQELALAKLDKNDQGHRIFDVRRALSLTENAIGRVKLQMGDPDSDGQNHFKRALELRQELIDSAKTEEQKVESIRLWANTTMNLGILHRRADEAQDARNEYLKAQERRLVALKLKPKNQKIRRDLAKGHYNLANLAIDRSKKESDAKPAVAHLRKAIEFLQGLLEENPNDLEDQYMLTLCRQMLGDVYAKLGETDPARRAEAVDEYAEAETSIRRLVTRNPDVANYRFQLARLMMNFGLSLAQQSQFLAARQRFLEARDILEELRKENADSIEQSNIAANLETVRSRLRMLQDLLKR